MPLGEVLREWGRIGCIGFGGPPAHVALLRELCVERRAWLDARAFEDANAACGLLPGPASTQLAIFCAHRAAGVRGAVVGGLAFIVPGLVLLLALAAVSLQDVPPAWVRGLAAGAGAAVVPVVAQAGVQLARTSLRGVRSVVYLIAGAAAAVLAGLGVVFVLIACGLIEVVVRRRPPRGRGHAVHGPGTLLALSWTALKVGALSYGGGFVIIPLMRADAVDVHAWMTPVQFSNAVAPGQLTTGPVTQTVGAVGYAAAGLGGGLLAAALAFLPSFVLVVLGAGRFERLRSAPGPRTFLDGAGPAAVGAILGASITLLDGVREPWQVLVLAGAVVLLLAGQGTVRVLLAAAVSGLVVALAGGTLP